MQCFIYTKFISIEHGQELRWFWRKPGADERQESLTGFTTRRDCEADAARCGYTAEEELFPRFGYLSL